MALTPSAFTKILLAMNSFNFPVFITNFVYTSIVAKAIKCFVLVMQIRALKFLIKAITEKQE